MKSVEYLCKLAYYNSTKSLLSNNAARLWAAIVSNNFDSSLKMATTSSKSHEIVAVLESHSWFWWNIRVSQY